MTQERWSLPYDEVAWRMPRLARIFTEKRMGVSVIPCCNVDATLLPAEINGTPLPAPSIRHSIVKCEACDVDMWIGPHQRRQEDATRICFICLSIVMSACPDLEPEIVLLNPNESEIPRRRLP